MQPKPEATSHSQYIILGLQGGNFPSSTYEIP